MNNLLNSDVKHGLDAAVADAYGWPATITEADALAELVSLNAKLR